MSMIHVAGRVVVPLGIALMFCIGVNTSAESQARLRPVRVLGGRLEDVGLYKVRAAAWDGPRLVVLTGAEPAIQVHEGSARPTSWGQRGRGPAELINPHNVLVVGERIMVRDSDLRKLASYDRSGTLVTTRTLTAGMIVRVEMAGRDTLADSFAPSGHTLVRLRGTRTDTIWSYGNSVPTIRLTAPGSASLSIPVPYAAMPAWAGLADGRVAVWDARGDALDVLDVSGRVLFRMNLPRERFPVLAQDREAWFASAVPGEIRGQQPFRGLQAVARREVRFPQRLPAVLSLRADPAGGTWVQQTTSATGQRWAYMAPRQPQTWFRLPPGQSLLAIGRREIAALARDGDGVESIHIYAHPRAN